MDSYSVSRSRYLQFLLGTTALIYSGASQAQAVSEDPSVSQGETDIVNEEASPGDLIIVRGVARKLRPDEQSSATGLNLSLVETPQAVTVITPEMLNTVGASSAYEATDLIPNVQRSGFGFGLQQVVMRGVFNLSRRVNSIELDNRLTSIRSYATERVEVVRGPATAIYGVTGGFGGEINSILKAPRNQFGLEVGAEYGSYDSSQYTIDVTGPIGGEGLSARVVGLYEEYELPLDVTGADFPNDQHMIMGALSWRPTDRTTIRGTFYHQTRNVDPWDGGALIDNGDGTLSLPDVDPEQWYFSHPDQSNEKTSWDFALLELEHQFGNGMYATTKLAWDQYDHDLEYFFPFGPFGGFALADNEVYIYSYDVERSGEQLTFSQSLGGDFELLGQEHQFFAAVEYQDDLEPNRFELLNSQFQGFATIDWLTDGVFDGVTPRFSDGTPFLPIAGDREAIFGVRQETLEETRDVKLSLQLLLKPADRLQLLLGVLYQNNKTIDKTTIIGGNVQDPPIVQDTKFGKTVFRAGVTYDLVDDVGFIDDARIYYNFSEGFEPQIIDDVDGNEIPLPQDMTQHEVGIKAELFDGAVGTAIAIFDYEISNIAVRNSNLGQFGGFGAFAPGGRQEATGVEFELIGELLPGWNVSANYAFMDAKVIDPGNLPPIAPHTTPKHSGAIISTYEFVDGPLNGLRVGGVLKLSGDYTFATPRNQERFGTVPLGEGGHVRFDLNTSYAPNDGLLEGFDFYLNWVNVFDEDILVSKQGHPGFGIMFIDQQKVTGGVRYRF